MAKTEAAVALCVLLVVLVVVLLSISIKRVDSTEYGLQYDRFSKQLTDDATEGGLHVGPPGFRFIKFPSTYISTDISDTCVSNDGLRVDFSVTFQYQIPAEWMEPAITRYRNLNGWKRIVEAAGNSAVQHSCSLFVVSEFQNKRGIIQSTMEDNLRTKLEGPTETESEKGVYARAISLQLRNVNLPDEYSQAVADKQSAAEDIQLARNQRRQEVTKAETALKEATEEGKKILETANNDANITLTQAYKKAEETLYAFQKEADVLVDVRQALGLTTEGLLAYLSNQLFASAGKLRVRAEEPTKISRSDEL